MRAIAFSQQALDEALSVLRDGGVVAHATETCYGLACDVSNIDAVKKLFAIKRRPETQPVSGLFASLEQAQEYAEWNERALKLAEEYLPGPLTVILPLREDAPKILHPLIPSSGGGRETLHKKSVPRNLLHFARSMRKEPTKAENILWYALRFDQLGVRFRRQHPVAGYIVDFFCHEAQLGIEVDGEVHDSKEQIKLDQERTQALESETGIHIMRFSNAEVTDDLPKVIEKIRHYLNSPSPIGGRGQGMGAKTIGIRISSHPVASMLVTAFESPLTTTSANVHGQPNPYSAEDIQAQFADAPVKPDLILDSGRLPQVPPSTIVDCTKEELTQRRAGNIKL